MEGDELWGVGYGRSLFCMDIDKVIPDLTAAKVHNKIY